MNGDSPQGPFLEGGRVSGLLTDLYELTMTAGYVQKGFEANAVFELFVRHLPPQRKYLVAAGLEQGLQFLENVRFSARDISYLRGLPLFHHVEDRFFDFLAGFGFTGDVWALPEGTIFFPGEPLLRVSAPIAQGQILETSLLSILHLQTLIASKAARLTSAAAGRPVIEFGSRRAHGIEAGILAARAAFIGGCQGSSNSFAGSLFQIPVYGTQAHSWVMAHEKESDAFASFLDVFPEDSTLVIDTYDVRAAVEKMIALARKPRAVRLDSGDVLADSRWVRERLDRAGWKEVQIFVSGDLDESRIQALVRGDAPINAFGVGTALSTSSDAPSLAVIYKLVELEENGQLRHTAKLSETKKTYPGRKQVFRFAAEDGTFARDVIGHESESFEGASPLIVPVMRGGHRLEAVIQDARRAVEAARERFLASRGKLSAQLLTLDESGQPFPVRYSARLEELSGEIKRNFFTPTSSDPTRPESRSRTTVFWEVDVQNDFMLPGGKLYVPGAENLIPNITRLVEACRGGRVLLVSSADAHGAADPEFADWPPHCVKGTPGAELVREASVSNCLVIPNQTGFRVPADALLHQQILLEKNTLDVFDNPNTDRLLEQLERSNALSSEPEFVVFGVVTEYCVRLTVEGLLKRGRRVAIVNDAVQPLSSRAGAQVLGDLCSRGARLVATEEALQLLLSSGAPDQTPIEEPKLG